MARSFVFVALCLASSLVVLSGVHAVRPDHHHAATWPAATGLEPVRSFVEADVASSPSSMMPSATQTCIYGGIMGTCKPVGACVAPNTRYKGLRPGSASLQCCVPPMWATDAAATAAVQEQVGANGRPKITQTTLQRLSESQHLLKWNRFKEVNEKQYASVQAEQAAYLTFRANRVRIIYLNDRFGEGYAIWRLSAPFADVDESAFQRTMTGAQMPDFNAVEQSPAATGPSALAPKARFAKMESRTGSEHGYVLPQPAPADVPVDISLPPPAPELATPVADVVLPVAADAEQAAWAVFQQQVAAQQEDALAMNVLASAHAPSTSESSVGASSLVEVDVAGPPVSPKSFKKTTLTPVGGKL